MTPATAIAILDRQISAHGEAVTLARSGSTETGRGIVRRATVEPLVDGGDPAQAGTMIVLSPTGWATVTPPARGDLATIGGRQAYVDQVETVRLADTAVRFNLQVRG